MCDQNAGCDMCGTNDRAPGSKYCQDCWDDMCHECEELSECCCCDDEECIRCGLDPDTCGCWDDDDDSLDCCEECGEPYEDCCCCHDCGNLHDDCTCCNNDDEDSGSDEDYCPGCGNYQYCNCDEFDNEFVSDTFRPMNAFERARWLKARGEL